MRRLDSINLAGDGVERGVDGAPVAFRIWKAGSNPTDKGDTLFTDRSAEMLLEEQARRGNLYSIDTDHLSLSKEAPPEARKAVGWHRLEVRNGELWAVDVSWTDAVRAGLAKEPPEWRYFSPSYDVLAKTGEVVSYVNTALTNNPATWNVTALASRDGTTKETAMADDEKKPEGEKDEAAAVLAAFKKMGKAAALAAMKAAFPDEPDGDEKKESSTKAAEDEPAKKDAEDDPEKKESKAASLKREAELLEEIGEQDRRLKALEKTAEETERAKILAARPDLTEKQLAALAKKPIGDLPELLELIPVAATKKHPNAVVNVAATRGAGQTNGGDSVTMQATRTSEHAERLDAAILGIRASKSPIGWEGDKFQVRLRTPSDARAHLKTIEARRAQHEVK